MSRGHAPERRGSDGRSTFERHLQSAMLTLATIGIVWLADSASQTKVTIAAMNERVNAISAQVQQLSAALTAIDDKNLDRAEAVQRFGDLERRIDVIERELRPATPPPAPRRRDPEGP